MSFLHLLNNNTVLPNEEVYPGSTKVRAKVSPFRDYRIRRSTLCQWMGTAPAQTSRQTLLTAGSIIATILVIVLGIILLFKSTG